MPFDATDYQVDPLTITDPRERLIYVRDFLLTLPDSRFDMGESGYEEDAEEGRCHSPSCIGGWARALFRYNHPTRGLIGVGMELFKLSSHDAHALFFPDGREQDAYQATPKQAARVIDHLLETGEVDWSVFRE